MPRKSRQLLERDEQIYQLTTLVAGAFSLQEVLDKLAEAAVNIVGVKACSIRLLDEQSDDLLMRSTYGLSEEYRNKGAVTRDDPVVKAAFAGEAVVLDDMRVDGRVQYREATLKEGLISQLTVAMQFRNKPIGVLRLYSPSPRRFDDDGISLARAIASQCATAITNARLYARAIAGARMAEQMRLAGLIQRRMIPNRAPAMPGLDIAATYIPCFDVGGDFYDFLQVSDTRIVVTMADVIGKGMPAALMMSWFRGVVHGSRECFRICEGGGYPMALVDGVDERAARMRDAVEHLNRMACRECKNGEFVTLAVAVLDTEDRTATYCNCGHEPTILLRGGETIDLDKGGLVLGVDPDATYDTETVDLKDNDTLLFYTDGLVDAVDFHDDTWGRGRMLEAARQFVGGSAERMIRNVLAHRRRFVGLAEQIDDTSIVVVKVGADAAEPRQTGD